jgi:predicted Rossmann-fold nucleotide-binding protein
VVRAADAIIAIGGEFGTLSEIALAMKLAKRAIDRGIETDPKGARQAEIEAIEEQLASGQWMGKT